MKTIRYNRSHRLSFTIPLVLLGCIALTMTSCQPQEVRIQKLVDQLGYGDFDAKLHTLKKLAAIGPPVVPILEQAMQEWEEAIDEMVPDIVGAAMYGVLNDPAMDETMDRYFRLSMGKELAWQLLEQIKSETP